MRCMKCAIAICALALVSCASTPKGPAFAPENGTEDSCIVYLASDKGLDGYPGGLPTNVRYLSENGDLRSMDLPRAPSGGYIPLRLSADRKYLFGFGKNYSLLFSGKKGSSAYLLVGGKFRAHATDPGTKILLAPLVTFKDLGALAVLKGGELGGLKQLDDTNAVSEEIKDYWKVADALDLR